MRDIRGWVYVLSNPAMPGLVKIGYSTKDPVLRIEELNGTGLPRSFQLEYDVLLREPRDIEQEVHRELAQHHEAKEFFRVDPAQAVAAIRLVTKRCGKTAISEQIGKRIAQDRSTEEPRSGSPLACFACRAGVHKLDSRCPKCFALLP